MQSRYNLSGWEEDVCDLSEKVECEIDLDRREVVMCNQNKECGLDLEKTLVEEVCW